MMQLPFPTYTKGIIESIILVGELSIHGNPNMGVLQNGMATAKSLMHHTIVFFCGFGCRVKGHNNGVIDNFVVVGRMRLPSRIHVSKNQF
jgi:hypothetical protein